MASRAAVYLLGAVTAAQLAVAFVSHAQAGPYHEPPPGSAERAAIMDSFRGPVEKELGQDVVFVVKTLRVTDDWAFLYATPTQPGGKPIDYRNTMYQPMVDDGTFGGGFAGLLARDEAGAWRIVTYSIGFGDVVWDSWDEEFGAPAYLWP